MLAGWGSGSELRGRRITGVTCPRCCFAGLLLCSSNYCCCARLSRLPAPHSSHLLVLLPAVYQVKKNWGPVDLPSTLLMPGLAWLLGGASQKVAGGDEAQVAMGELVGAEEGASSESRINMELS